MPSGITHLVLSRFSLDRLDAFGQSGDKAKSYISSEVGPFYLGSVGPDLPYLSVADTEFTKNHKTIADDLHYQKTNAIPIRGLEDAANLVKKGEIDKAVALFSFYAGYASHLIADGIIHPYVRDMVGDYAVASGPHRILEMKLDVLICRRLFGTDVNGTDLHDEINWMEDCKFEEEIYAHYAQNINQVHGYSIGSDDIRRWKAAMDLVFGVAEGEFPKWYREFLGDKGITFKNYSDLRDEEMAITKLGMPIDAKKHGLTSNFMNKAQVDFFEDVMPKYFATFPQFVMSAYEMVFNGKALNTDLVPAINLDTGRMITTSTLKDTPALWIIA